MKKVLSIAAIAVFALSFTSCKKCVTCTYDFWGTSYTAAEVCGKRKEINEYVEAMEATWGATCE